MADADVLAEIDKVTKSLPDALLTDAGNVMTDHVTGYSHEAMRDALVAVCATAAETHREIAELWIKARKKDSKSRALRAKGAATGFEDVATLLRQLKLDDATGEQAVREPRKIKDPFNYDLVRERYSGAEDHDGYERPPAEPEQCTRGYPLSGIMQDPNRVRRCMLASGHDGPHRSGPEAWEPFDDRAAVDVEAPSPQPLTVEQGEAVADAKAADSEATRAYIAGETDALPAPHGFVLRESDLADVEPQAVDVVRIGRLMAEAEADMARVTDLVNGLRADDVIASWAYNREGISTVSNTAFPFSEPVGPGATEVKPLTFGELASLPRDAMPEHLSWSQITSLEDCATAYGIERLGGHKGKPNWSTVGGKAVHRVIEMIEQSSAAGAPAMDQMMLQTLWDMCFGAEIQETVNTSGVPSAQWRVPNRGLEGYDWWRVEGMKMIERYMENHHAVPQREILRVPHSADGATSLEPCIEYEMVMDVAGVPVKLVIDQAWRLADGSILIVDVKTGRSAPDDGQLGLYAWALQGLLNHSGRIFGSFYDARKGTYSEPVDLLERHPWEEYQYRVAAAQERRQAKYLAPRRSSFCNGCGVQALCPVGRR